MALLTRNIPCVFSYIQRAFEVYDIVDSLSANQLVDPRVPWKIALKEMKYDV